MSDTLKNEIDRISELVGVISVPIERSPGLTGISRARIFEAVRDGQLTVRKNGKASIVEVDELRRYVRSLPTRGRQPEQPPA